MANPAERADSPHPDEIQIDQLVERARTAQARYAADPDQARFHRAAQAIGWALMEPSRNQRLSELAVAQTGLGKVADKVLKNHRKTLGLLRDIGRAQTCGIVTDDAASGITEIRRPVGVVGAVVPSTNPVATPTNNAINALACGNAIILAPSPKGVPVCEQLLAHIHTEFAKCGIDPDLVQMVPAPASKIKTQRLMEQVDLLVVTGSQDNVRRAYRSGTPAIGVGAGNVPVIVDESADLGAAAAKITASKCFDNATSCSSENSLIVVDAIADELLAALHAEGARLLDPAQGASVHRALFTPHGLNPRLLARDFDAFCAEAGVPEVADEGARFAILEAGGIGPEHPESGEKLSLVLSLYRARDFDHARAIAAELLAHLGAGHSVGLHSAIDARAVALAETLPSCRVIVNQAHCFATGGAFNNAMPFSLSMGCGSWGGNSIDDNLHWRHFVNRSRVVRPIASDEPELSAVFGDYWQHAGQ